MKNKKHILVTGASRGIGKAITKKLVAEGYHVIMIARDEKVLLEAQEEIGKESTTSSVLDLSDIEAVKEFTKTHTEPLYGIINNAGVCKTADILSDEDPWEEVMNTNLNGLYYLTRGLAQYIEGNGRIVNISSQLGKNGRAGFGAYSASKFAINGLTKCWAHDLGKKGITVNSVCPGWVMTEMAEADSKKLAKEQGITIEEYYKDIVASQELKRINTPEEVASLVGYLISPEAGGVSGRDFLMQTIWNQE